jgi:hypothetical protein
MGFLVPAFLAGLAAIVVPIVLHLRHKDKDTPHRFPSLMFVDRLPIRTAQRRRITDWPLLLLRALAIVLLVLAFARPLWWKPGIVSAATQPRTVILLLDRSMSMSHRGVWPAALDSARRIVSALGPDDRAALVLFDDEADVAQPLTADRALVLAALARARAGAVGTRFAAGLRAARQIASDARTGTSPVDVVLISDLQRAGTVGLAGLELPGSFHVRAVALSPAPRTNASVSVADARPFTEGGREKLAVTAIVAARGPTPARRTTVMLRVNGRPSGTRVVDAGAGDTRVAFDPVPIPAGQVHGEVTIDLDSLAADDTARFALTSSDEIAALLVAPDDADRDETLYLERALAVGRAPAVRLQRVRAPSLDAETLKDAALVILWDLAPPRGSAGTTLTEWTTHGGGLVQVAGRRLARRGADSPMLPATVDGLADRSDDRGGSLGDVRIDHPLLAPFRETPAALVAPRFLRYTRLEPANAGQVVARFDDGSAAVVERAQGSGRVIMLGAPLDARSGDFPLQPAFVPFVRRLALFATHRDATVLARETGQSWLLPSSAQDPVVSAPDGSILRPEREVRAAGDTRAVSVPLRHAGLYVLHDGEARGAALRELAVNSPAAESDLTAVPPAELLASLRPGAASASADDAPPTAAEIERRQGLWRLVIGGLAVLLLLEMLMASRGWRGVANPVSTVTPSGEGT